MLLVDEGIGRDLVQALVAEGFVAIHWLDIGPKGASDSLAFFQAQQRGLALFTHNRDDYVLLATAWHDWGLGDHHGVIAPRPGMRQLIPPRLYPVMRRYCADLSSFVNRIELY